MRRSLSVTLLLGGVVCASLACSGDDDEPGGAAGMAGNSGSSSGGAGGASGGNGGASGGVAGTGGSGGSGAAGDAGASGALGGGGVAGVSGAGGGSNDPVTFSVPYDFTVGEFGWNAAFSDYSTLTTDLELASGIQALPLELGVNGTGFMIQGHNRSDDLFMFLKRRIGTAEGVVPNQAYTINYSIIFASNAQTGCSGIGGSPGASVYLKAGGSTSEPMPVTQDGFVSLSVDKGNQSTGGPAASVVSNIENGQECDNNPTYVSLTKLHTHDTPITSDSSGNLWLLVGTDSGFEGLTRLYYQRIRVTLEPIL
jgi:hypothetical protein